MSRHINWQGGFTTEGFADARFVASKESLRAYIAELRARAEKQERSFGYAMDIDPREFARELEARFLGDMPSTEREDAVFAAGYREAWDYRGGVECHLQPALDDAHARWVAGGRKTHLEGEER